MAYLFLFVTINVRCAKEGYDSVITVSHLHHMRPRPKEGSAINIKDPKESTVVYVRTVAYGTWISVLSILLCLRQRLNVSTLIASTIFDIKFTILYDKPTKKFQHSIDTAPPIKALPHVSTTGHLPSVYITKASTASRREYRTIASLPACLAILMQYTSLTSISVSQIQLSCHGI